MTARLLDIAVVAHDVVRADGQGRAVLELVAALADRGHRVAVLAHRVDPSLSERVEHRRIRRLPGPQLLDDLWLFAAATVLVRRRRLDVAVVLGPCALPRAPFAYYAQFSHTGWAATWRAGARPGPYHRVHTRLGRRLEGFVTRRAALVVACGEQVGRDLGATRVVVVPNGVDLEEFTDLPERDGARNLLGLPSEAPVVAFIGEYRTGRKGLDHLLEAVACGDEHLVVAGDGDGDRLQARAAALGASDRVHPVGFVPAPTVLAAADVAAVPSRYEPFSLVAVEAAAAGLPVVLARQAGACVHLPSSAVAVERPDDIDELRAALDEARRRAASDERAARRREASALTWDRCAASVADAVERAAT